jgi:23S rRNA (uracil1939-C5)-methyltransferase
MRENDVPGYAEGAEGCVRHIFVRTATSGRTQVCVMVQGDRLRAADRLPEFLQRAVPDLASVVLGFTHGRLNTIACERYKTIWGADALDETLCGLQFRLSPASFFQVNPAQAERLYNAALDLAELNADETALDLYCGTGTITLLLAQRAGLAIGAEIVAPAIADAEENARRNGVPNARFLCADAANAAAQLAAEGLHPDVVTVDPPRKGLAPAVVETIAQMAPKRVVYVSCDPATLARDVARFAAQGYRLSRALAVDMFPRCAHVETVVLMSRKDT